VIGVVAIAIASLIQLGIGYSLSRRLQLLTQTVQATRKNHFPAVTENPGKDELGTLIVAYNDMTTTIDRLMKEVYEEGLMVNRLAVEKRHAELEALVSKIDPHFLSNSLNTIRMKSLSRKEVQTADALKALGRLFDYMTAWQDETILVRQEVEFISGYLALQRYRFGTDYKFEIQVEPAALDLPLPRMLVQPLVENASKHGIEQKKMRGRIEVRVRKREDRLEITVADDGRGMDPHTLARQRERLGGRSKNGESIGMQNVYNRLQLIFGEDAEFELLSRADEGTTVRLSFPYVRLQNHVESNSR
jgi:two-component system sensor histidine kinase YesM